MQWKHEPPVPHQPDSDFRPVRWRLGGAPLPWRASLADMGSLPSGGMGHLGKAAPCAAQFRRRVTNSSGIAHTLVEMAKLNDAAPQAWLTDIFGRAAENKITKLDERLPWHYAE
jgi:hypothetical protein